MSFSTSGDGTWRWEAEARGLAKVTGRASSERACRAGAKAALRRAAYERSTTGWTDDRRHAVVAGTDHAFCGAEVEDSPFLGVDKQPTCGRCECILAALVEEFDTTRKEDSQERATAEAIGL